MNCINVAEILTIMQLKKHFLLACTMLLCFGASLLAQDKKITGNVHSATGAGVAGASVYGKTSKRGTATDNAGNFTITVPQSESALTISSLGFVTKDVSIAGKTVIDVTLADDPKQLTDVVVTAYGIKKETRKLGYTVQEVKGADLVKAREPNAVNSLAGKVAGLSVGASAEMLGRPELVLRGSKDLLFVVDGSPINSDTWNISADDIETYTILKGPNAAALYGSRGINGAIVITTKKGSKDKKGWQVDFNSSTIFDGSFIATPEAQTEYGRGNGYHYEYQAKDNSNVYVPAADALYDNGNRLGEFGPRFEGQLLRQYDSPYDPVTGIRSKTPWLARGVNNFKTL
jgi:TonB-dependent SusC/RagA subfamily outer membrane receptor